MVKRLFIVACAVVLGQQPSFADIETIDGITWTYTVTNGVASVGGGSSSSPAVPITTSGSLTIPSELGGYPVVNIGEYAFSGCQKLTDILIPGSVTNIGYYAFNRCKGLTSVTIPSGVTSIRDYTFGYCSGLTSINIPVGVTNIVRGAFIGCSGLMRITVDHDNPEYSSANGLLLSKNGTTLLQGVNGDVTIPEGVTSVGAYAFSGRSGLTRVVIPNGVTSIGSFAFSGCSGLTNVTIPDSVTRIGASAFYDCSALKRIVFEGNAPTLGTSPFLGVTPEFNTFGTVGPRGEPNESPYSSATWSVQSVVYCQGTNVVQSGQLPNNTGMGNVYVSWLTTTVEGKGVLSFWWKSNAQPMVESPYATGGWAGDSLRFGTYDVTKGITNEIVRLTNQVDWCEVVYTNETDSSVSFAWAFVYVDDDCNNGGGTGWVDRVTWTPIMHTVAFDANGGICVESNRIVSYGSALGMLPSPTRNGYAFVGWFTAAEGGELISDEYTITADFTLYAQWTLKPFLYDIKDGKAVIRRGMPPEGDIVVPSVVDGYSVSGIADSAFRTCGRLTGVTIPDGVTSIGHSAFSGCSNLVTVTIPTSVTRIGGHAFDNCPNLQYELWDGYKVICGWLIGYTDDAESSISDADDLRGIISGALEGCVALKELSFDENALLVSIGTSALKGCTELQTLVLPPSLEEIGDEAFMGCSFLDGVIVPGNVRRVGARAFKNCTGFTAAQIEHGVQTIGEEAFYGDWRISEVDIPSTVSSIGVNAFGGDSSIIRIGLRGDSRMVSEIFSNYRNIREATVKHGNGNIIDGLFTGCSQLTDVHFQGNCPSMIGNGTNLYNGTSSTLVTYIEQTSTGWDGTPGSHALPQAWPLTGNYRRSIAWWDVPTYLVRFDSNGGTLGVQQTYQYSEKPFTLPPEPVQTGYKFAGWWTKRSGGLQVTSDTVFIEGVYTTLYAHWLKGHWVFLDPNGGTVTNDFVTYIEQTVYGVLPVAVRPGYTFGGWSYNGRTVLPTTELATLSDHTITAQWKVNQYTMTFNTNGGTGGKTVTQDYDTALSAPMVTRTGYTFDGWSPVVPATVPAGNATYTAQWKANKYTVTFDANGGEGGKSVTQDYGTALSAPTVTKTGYTFDGWSPAVPTTVPAGNATYTAQWKANRYTMTFDANGGTGGKTVTQDYGTALAAPTVTKTGYTFDGWSPTVPATVPAGNATYTAQWKANQYTLTFDANGGNVSPTSKRVTYDATYGELPTPIRAGYRFEGWFTATDSGEQATSDTTVTGDVTCYAHWTKIMLEFAEDEIRVDENANAVVRVTGGSPERASSAKVYLTYNTATAADVDLAKGTVRRVEDAAPYQTNLKFPLTLKWTKGNVGEQTVTIPIKKDALVEGEEFFTLQLAAANGAEMGEQTVCTVRIADAQWPDGMTPEETAARGLAILPAGATAVKDAAGVMTGYFTKKDKKGNVTAKAMPGYIFTGWYDTKGKKVGAKAALADKTRKSKKATPRFAMAHYLRGLADPANGGKVKGSGKYAAGKKVTLKATPKKNWTFEGWRLGVPVAATSAAAPATGYVSKAKSLTVAVTNELTYLAMFKPYPKVTVAVDNAKGGTVKGAGAYKTGTAVTLKATPKKGYAFCGWFDADGNLVSLKANYKYKVTADGLALSASFKKESALAKPVLTWGDYTTGETPVVPVNGQDARSPSATNLMVGVSYSAKLAVKGESAVAITKVTGLPKGLAFKSGKVSGVPTVAKAVTAKVTVALKSNTKKTWTYSVKLNVSVLPTWAVGTFKGKGTFGGKDADVTLTVGKTGKISGKFVAAGKQYPFSVASFAELDAQGVLRTAKGTMKYGTKTCKVEIAVAEGEGGGEAAVAVTGGVTASGALVLP